MRKSISSLFILLLLLLVLWGISAWYLGIKTEQNLKEELYEIDNIENPNSDKDKKENRNKNHIEIKALLC